MARAKGLAGALAGVAVFGVACAQKIQVEKAPAEPAVTAASNTARAPAATILWDIFHEALHAPAAESPGPLLGRFKITFYWVESPEGASGRPVAIYDRACQVIAKVPAGFAKRMRLQGTARLEDGRLVNIAGRCPCPRSPCFFVADEYPWGVGAAMRPLVPFRSVAVDRDLIAIGDTLYVPALDGVRVPGEKPWGGYVHDGCVVADDVGGGIDGRHIDFFTGGRWGFLGLAGLRKKRAISLFAGGDRCPTSPR